MVETTFTTETEAVNYILQTGGFAQISDASTATGRHARTAKFLLEQANRDIQIEGWYFNTEDDVEYEPDSETDEVDLSQNDELWVRQYVWGYETGAWELDHIVLRDGRLYNLTDHTYEFDGTVHLTVVYHRAWAHLPMEFRQYITMKAATEFATQYASQNPGMLKRVQAREAQARAICENMQARILGYNSNQALPIMRITGRPKPPVSGML